MQSDYGKPKYEPDTWDTAEICLNGHVITSRYEDMPHYRSDHCQECGEVTIHACAVCSAPIRGHLRGSFDVSASTPKLFCHKCGKPFPWTERRLIAAKELASQSAALSDDELKTFGQSLEELTKQTPLIAVAARKLRPLVSKMEPTLAAAIREVVVSLLSGEAKRIAGL
jgi:hypothetical protein